MYICMFVYMYVCMYRCLYVYMHVYMYVCLSACTYTSTYMHMRYVHNECNKDARARWTTSLGNTNLYMPPSLSEGGQMSAAIAVCNARDRSMQC